MFPSRGRTSPHPLCFVLPSCALYVQQAGMWGARDARLRWLHTHRESGWADGWGQDLILCYAHTGTGRWGILCVSGGHEVLSSLSAVWWHLGSQLVCVKGERYMQISTDRISNCKKLLSSDILPAGPAVHLSTLCALYEIHFCLTSNICRVSMLSFWGQWLKNHEPEQVPAWWTRLIYIWLCSTC